MTDLYLGHTQSFMVVMPSVKPTELWANTCDGCLNLIEHGAYAPPYLTVDKRTITLYGTVQIVHDLKGKRKKRARTTVCHNQLLAGKRRC